MASWRTVVASIALISATLAGAAACGTGSSAARPPASAGTAAARASTVWLCRPGLADDPCAGRLDTTVVPAHGAAAVQRAPAQPTPPFDCFYVYGTVGGQTTPNANLAIQPGAVDSAILQAQRFSQVCNVWAPVYRQQTQAARALDRSAINQADNVAYASLLSAWNDYLRNDNDGRPVIFIGHSQGAAVLIRLLAAQVDRNPSLRARMVVAILAGGNVIVPPGKIVGASFRDLPLCTAAAQTGCVIAYSTFPSEPPTTASFGRPGRGVSNFNEQYATTGVQVACVNPAALSGGTADLAPEFPAPGAMLTAPPFTSSPASPQAVPWVAYPRLYSAACQSADGATWLQVNDIAARGDTRPVVSEVLGPDFGYHPFDINLVLGNLISDVTREEAAYTAAHR